MNPEKINDFVNKLPITLILLGYLGYLGYDYYLFENDDTSPKIQKKKEIDAEKATKTKVENRLKELNEFVKTLQNKKVEIRGLAQQLQAVKGTIADTIDVPNFMKMVITEAKKMGMKVISLKPTDVSNKEYYAEHNFNFVIRGVFAQVVGFMDRLSNVNQIVRIENFHLKPVQVGSKFVELEGEFELKTYRYLGSKADIVGTSDTPISKGAAASGSKPSSPSAVGAKAGGGQ